MEGDDEGTPVYFRTSPSLEGLEKQFTEELSFHEADGRADIVSLSNKPAYPDNREWRESILLHLGLIRDLSPLENECCHGIATAIRDSPLLTEEDYHLLYFALLKPHPLDLVNKRPLSTSPKRAVVVVLVSVLAACLTTQLTLPVSLLLSMMLLVAVSCSGAVVRQTLSGRRERVLLMARQSVTDCCREMEGLLSLLSHSLRTLQEVELVDRHYARASALRGAANSAHQCLGLRFSIFSQCQRVIGRFRATTLSLSQLYPLNREVDGGDVSKYLANSSLSSLHTHLTIDLDSITTEERRNHKCLSQESLKDAANLLGVQSSELLRHTALSLLSPYHTRSFSSTFDPNSGILGTDSGLKSGTVGTNSGPESGHSGIFGGTKSGSSGRDSGPESGPSGTVGSGIANSGPQSGPSGTVGSGIANSGPQSGPSGTVGSGIANSGPESGPSGRTKASLLKFVCEEFDGLREAVRECRLNLEWTCDLHRNHLFGDPPRRPANTAYSGSDGVKSLRHSIRDSTPLELLARDVHCLDLKTQAALQRIRSFGDDLSVKVKVAESIPECEDQLRVIQRMVDGVSDHIEDSLSLLHRLQQPTHTLSGTKDEESETEDTVKEITENPTLSVDEGTPTTSEDEMVYEGYAPEEKGEGVCGSRCEEGEVGREEREMSEKMVRELEDVLAVRSERREMEREKRRRKRRKRERKAIETETEYSESCRSTSEKPLLTPQTMNDEESEREREKPSTVVTNSNSEDSQSQLSTHTTSTADDEPLNIISTELEVGVDLASMAGAMAARAAAIAAQRRRDKHEETFASDQDTSQSE